MEDMKREDRRTISIKDTLKLAMQSGSMISSIIQTPNRTTDNLASKNLELTEEIRSLRMQLNAYKLMYSASKRMQSVAA